MRRFTPRDLTLYLLLARHPGRALPAAAADLQTLIRQALDGAFLLSG